MGSRGAFCSGRKRALGSVCMRLWGVWGLWEVGVEVERQSREHEDHSFIIPQTRN